MWIPRNGERNEVINRLVAVAIDKDKGSQGALRWAIDNLLNRGQSVVLVHVKTKPSGSFHSSPSLYAPRFSHTSDGIDENVTSFTDSGSQAKEFFLPFRCFCTRKDIQCQDVVLEDTDVVNALVEFVTHSAIEILVLGAPSKGGILRRFKATDIPGSVSKQVPDFCTVYVISKGKISSTRSASRPAPAASTLRNQISHQASNDKSDQQSEKSLIPATTSLKGAPRLLSEPSHKSEYDLDYIKSPFTHRKGLNGKPHGDYSSPDTDISYVSSGRASIDRIFPSLYDSFETSRSPRLSSCSELENVHHSFESMNLTGHKSVDTTTPEFSLVSQDSDKSSSSQTMDDVEAEMRRLKLELKQTMDMYSTACKEALTAKQKAKELQRWKMEEEQRLEEARLAEEAALSILEKEKAKSRAAIEAAEAAQRIAELESQKRINAEMKANKEAEEKNRVLRKLAVSDVRYRKYTIDEIEAATNFFSESRKIGEGGYGPVYKCYLDHTHVAVKVLRPDAAQGRSQFQQEVEVLSCIRHPNMVLLLGACPEYGCLVYEYMSHGSLEDCLFRRANSTTPPLSWQQRFRIAAEIGTGLHFLHQTKPEPLVHRDLKPGNILLDRNFVSKISDVGLARLVPPAVADNVTQYRMTSTAGTFCYIDPEYQQTGMLGVKSDIYSLGIMFLQLITARPPMGLTHHVERSIEKGTFAQMLDPAVPDWPVQEALLFAKMSLKCAELRRRDRPDLAKVVMPLLEKLRGIADESVVFNASTIHSPNHSQVSMSHDGLSYPATPVQSG
ncbi:hypothetical protein CsSME_00048736 [Camellia sinensis var. sinensis]|uniref:U-box domain-containing protein 52-like n=1 Tax=Camellia sinensis TaxID=4442 RepID=UPI001035E220|nr:U-box domain-containing protein 52-like [Camellia sinensis]